MWYLATYLPSYLPTYLPTYLVFLGIHIPIEDTQFSFICIHFKGLVFNAQVHSILSNDLFVPTGIKLVVALRWHKCL